MDNRAERYAEKIASSKITKFGFAYFGDKPSRRIPKPDKYKNKRG